ncbi:MAG: cell division protein ZipA C-terminal FtsZ-binding domain-containing protein [Gammaproteobacteria bacterium]|jgi:cell division protein ZipA|nr:cell division protein ZipA C-terminal FtsZ-binding domain-containing protein [Gammaproteobacteria bacterium]MDP6617693.1 cell division protein ZipA C-terminal FtsZ-binding domain-containing protein [Gammaproteobacteria bacterium]MDP6695310.1 cell division protein ZipA C-terminal FtsZ-binding domain-containing protein [Gammaproteobacteria bacterium]
MALFRWVLLVLGVALLGLVFAYSRGWIPKRVKLPDMRRKRVEPVLEAEPVADDNVQELEPVEVEPSAPVIEADSRVVTVRIMPQYGEAFPAEPLILSLRSAGLVHGQFGIFHCQDEDDPGRSRYSVASLVEPGSFDLSNLKESGYPGVSIFMVLPAPENGVELFDQMVATARAIARDMDGHLVDEQGGALSLQRERYMREEVIQFLLQHNQGSGYRHDDQQDMSAAG